MLFVEEGAAVEGDYYLEMLKKHLYARRRLFCGQKMTIQQYGACTIISVISWKIDLLISVTSIYLICNLGHNEKDAQQKRKAIRRYRLSAELSDALDGLTKKIIQSINCGCN